MKKVNVATFAFGLVLCFLLVGFSSCSDEEVISDDIFEKRIDRPVGPDEPFSWPGYYTRIQCGWNIFEKDYNFVLEEFFEDKDQCLCFSNQYLEENCSSGDLWTIQVICKFETRQELPFGAECEEDEEGGIF